jgi:tetratricopeptide (TPR) repeat protein
MRLYHDKLYKKSADVFSYLLENYPKAPQMPQWRVSYVRSLEGTVYQQSEAPENRWVPYPRLSDEAVSKYRKVAELYKDIISAYPYAEISVEARIRLGAVYQELGMYDESLKYYAAVITDFPMYPGSRSAYRGKAEVHIRRGELEEAEQTLQTAKGQPGLPPQDLNRLHFLLAKLKFYQGEFPASGDLLALITKSGNDNITNDALELSMTINGAMKDSLALLEFSRAEQLLAGGKYSEAEQKYTLMHLNEKYPFLLRHTAQVRIAHLMVSAGKFREAGGFIDTILAKEKNIFGDKLMFLLGNMLEYGIKDTPGAVSVYEDFLSKFPKSIFTEEVREKLVRLKNKSSS